jgi:hypothetical protein
MDYFLGSLSVQPEKTRFILVDLQGRNETDSFLGFQPEKTGLFTVQGR